MMRRELAPSSIEIARAVLVDGVKQAALAKERNLTVQNVSQIVSRVRRSHLENGLTPDGWQQIEVCLPNELVPVVKAMEADARHRLNIGDDEQ